MTMSINKNIPQIEALKKRVEQVAGRRLTTHVHFLELVENIESTLREHISETTLERLWGYSTRHYDKVSLRTLDVLCRYVGDGSWESFIEKLRVESRRESGLFTEEAINCRDLAPGACVRIGWMPDRMCKVRYVGNYTFEVIDSVNSSIEVGDVFTTFIFQKGRPLYLDNYHKISDDKQVLQGARYAVGQDNGLTTLEIIN